MNYKLLYLQKILLPNDIIQKIIIDHFSYVLCRECYKKKYNFMSCKKCNICDGWLCNSHAERALKWGKYYHGKENYRMCDICCWNEIT